MTAFVESFATQQLLPPWHAKGAQISGFVIRMNRRRIGDYLAKYFNGAYPDVSPYQYEPLDGDDHFALLTCSAYPTIRPAANGPDSHPVSGGQVWNFVSYHEVYLAFPVQRRPLGPDGVVGEPTVIWVQPAVYSDNDTIVFSSREIWGTDMFLATIETNSDGDGLHLDAGIVAVKTFDPRSIAKLMAFLHIRATLNKGLDLPQILAAKPELDPFVAILGASGMFAGGVAPAGVSPAPHSSGIELNNLKQFRDCYDMGNAIYRAIVASHAAYSNVGKVLFYDSTGIDIAFMWSDSLGEFLETILDAKKPVLGVTPAADFGPPPAHDEDWTSAMDWDMDRVVVPAEFGFRIVADLDFKVLSTLHTYGTAT